MKLDNELINSIREKSDIVEVISSYLTLNKSGRNHVAVCPFHNDTNPSMMISSTKQIYKCFSCGAGGNVFTFVSNYEKVPFPEAVVKVAKISNINVDISLENSSQTNYTQKEKDYYSAYDEAINYCNYQLNLVENKIPKDYLLKRGLTDDIINRFKIGYNPPNKLNDFLLKKGISRSVLLDSNLIRSSSERDYDVFSGRIVFPIFDRNGKPVAISARSIDNTVPKYINSAETDLYIKSNILYNFNNARLSTRKEKNLYIVEGVMDVITFAIAGVDNVVATLGTNLSTQQISQIKSITNKVVLSYDDDNPGQIATYKLGGLLNQHGINVNVVKSFEGNDPDDFRMKNGNDAFHKKINETYNWIEFLMSYLLKDIDINNFSDKKKYTEDIIRHISLLDELERDYYLNILSKTTNFSKDVLSSFFPKVNSKSVKQKTIEIKQKKKTFKNPNELEILNQMLLDKEAYLIFQEHLGYLIDDNYNRIVRIISDYYMKYDRIVVADLISMLDNQELVNILTNLGEIEYLPNEFNKNSLIEMIRKVKAKSIELRIKDLKKSRYLKQVDDLKLALEIAELERERNRIIKGELQ